MKSCSYLRQYSLQFLIGIFQYPVRESILFLARKIVNSSISSRAIKYSQDFGNNTGIWRRKLGCNDRGKIDKSKNMASKWIDKQNASCFSFYVLFCSDSFFRMELPLCFSSPLYFSVTDFRDPLRFIIIAKLMKDPLLLNCWPGYILWTDAKWRCR